MNFVLALSLLWCGLALAGNAKQRIPALNSYDPGSCNKKTHGKEVLVKDRSDKEIILICAKDKGVYQWESIDGSKNTIGEFFNPGLNCSDILDKLEDANDGFYWITLKRSSPIKVFCDMTTDAGGFMLIGRKTNSITWTVPSNNTTVEPYGKPHWSSSLGDAPILDFRVQMATKEDFKETKAHWFYRLLSKRPLKNLMTNTDGCDQRSAGIGNIAYVKDLLTENIVTTKLKCSKFGFAYHPLVKFGWHKMNSCLQKPCPWGFAFHDVVKHQVDFYGGFSFSTTQTISGMEFNATASVGCDNGYCCGCYGPVGGTKHYCAENCKAINGGTVTKNVFTWFWVRSSLPKRLWEKCMDYQVKRDDGKLISYKLIGHSVIPVEGSCSKDSTLLHDGIVVVPDSSSAQKVPAVDGLLEYRKDKQELYIRSNKTWNVLAQENKILEETNERNRLNLDRIKRLGQNLQNEKKIILQETNKKHQLNLDKIKRLDQNLRNEKKIILQETNKKDKLNLDKIKKLDQNLQNEKKIILKETNKKHQLNLDKIKRLDQNLQNEKKIVNQRISQLENLIKKHDSSIKKLNVDLFQPKECFGYKWLRESNRNQKYSSDSNCDSGFSGWYRFGGAAGTKIATSCVPKNRCGTYATGWMNGTHPTVAQGKVTRKVCYNWSGNCCNWSNNIEVVNCGQYYVYKLSDTPSCNLRYCGSDN